MERTGFEPPRPLRRLSRWAALKGNLQSGSLRLNLVLASWHRIKLQLILFTKCLGYFSSPPPVKSLIGVSIESAVGLCDPICSLDLGAVTPASLSIAARRVPTYRLTLGNLSLLVRKPGPSTRFL